MRSPLTPRILVALAALVAVLVMAPFSVALSVHHQLAAADHDGHHHSDFDLCQWVQYHANGSAHSDVPGVQAFLVPERHPFPEPSPLLSYRLPLVGQPRAPPAV